MSRFIVFTVLFFLFTSSGATQAFISHRYSPTVFNNGYTAVADFDRDGNIDILNITSFTFKEFYIHYHDGTLPLNMNAKQILPTGSYAAEFSTVDKDNDGDMDILTVKDDKLAFLINKSTSGNFQFELETLPISFVTKIPILLAADFDKDGRLDILVGDRTGKIKVFYNKDNGYVEYDIDFIQPLPVEANLKVIRLSDLNNDGLLDIVIGSLNSEKKGLMTYMNQGNVFKPFVILDKITVWDIKLVDFDKDGMIDILTSGKIGNKRSISLWKNDLNSSNKFVPSVLINRSYDIQGVNTLDINKDGAMDIVATVEQWSGDTLGGLSVYISNGNQENLSFSEINIPDFPKDLLIESIFISDLDNDGDQDFITYTMEYWVENRLNTSNVVEDNLPESLLLYPNPASDYIEFNINEKSNLKISTVTGIPLMELDIYPDEIVDIHHLSPGIYYAITTSPSMPPKTISFIKQ